jgi:plastocyanin domain-containing protein
MNTLIVNIAGVLLMAFIVWWFWLYRPRQAASADDGIITVTVDDGVYDPAYIRASAGKPLTLRFLRRDPSPCAQQVIFQGLDISEELPVGKPKDIQVQADEPGEYRFTCQMNMYQGKLKVE